MASVQSTRKRIHGVAKTKQITRSMRLVSFSKVQTARIAFENNQPYYKHVLRIMDVLAATYTARKDRVFAGNAVNKTGILAISTDRGLCGAYNMNVVRHTVRLAREKKDTHVIAIGSKSAPALRRENIEIDFGYIGISESPIVEEAEMLSAQVLELYLEGEIDELYVVHHQFLNMLEQQVVAQKLLPYPQKENSEVKGLWSFEPAEEDIISNAAHTYITAALYSIMLESALCEQSARVSSMDAAARNSDELLAKLTLQFNKMRQEIITNEIIEVVSGALFQKKNQRK